MQFEGRLIRHADKVMNELSPEDITDEQLTEVKNQFQTIYPGAKLPTDEFFSQSILNEHDAAIFGPEDDGGNRVVSGLTLEGVIRAQADAKEFAESIDSMPTNAVILIGPSSTVPRAGETQFIYEQEAKAKARQNNGLTILENMDAQRFIPEDELPPHQRVVIINHGETKASSVDNSLIGREGNKTYWANPYYEELGEIFKGSEDKYSRETLAIQVWLARQSELEELRDSLVKEGIIREDQKMLIDPSRYEDIDSTPERIAQHVAMFISQMAKEVQRSYPNRPVYYFGDSHNMMLDAASVRLLGDSISRENVLKLVANPGDQFEASLPLEGRKFKFERDRMTFSFRGREKTWTIEELDNLIEELNGEAEERMREWEAEKTQ